MLPKSLRVTFRLSDSALAIPKSRTLTRSSVVTLMLRGLRSPCSSERSGRPSIVTSKPCAASRNSHSWTAMPAARSELSGPAAMTSERFAPLEVLHRDVEVAPLGAVLVHRRHVAARPAELLLKLRAPALRLEDFARLPVVARRHQLQRDPAVRPGVRGEKHRRHPAAADLLENLVRSDALEDRRHHRP